MIHAFLTNLEELDRTPATVRLRRFYLGRFARDIDPTTATTVEIRTWLDTQTQWSQSSQYAAFVSIRACYRWAHDEGLIATDPARRVRLDQPVDVNRPIIDELSLHRALKTATLAERVMIRLGAECGLRIHEIVKVRLEDLHGSMLTVLGKGRRLRRVHASPELVADMHALCPDGGYCFPGRFAGHLSTSAARVDLKRVTGHTPHSLRRRAATVLYHASGHDVRLVQRFLGHSSINTTMLYLGVEIEDLVRASDMTRLAA